MSWLTTLVGLRNRRFPLEDEATAATIRAEWLAESMEAARREVDEPEPTQVLYRWDGHWTRWSELSCVFEPVEGRLIPATLVEFGNSLDRPPTEGDRFRFRDGVWKRLEPHEPDEPVESNEPESTAEQVHTPKVIPVADLPSAKSKQEVVADQIASWRQRIRREHR